MWEAAEQVTYTPGSVSIPVTMLVLLLCSVFVSFGVLYARWQRDVADHKAIKAGVKALRKSKWAGFWRMIKVGFLLFVFGVFMIVWVAHDVRGTDAKESKPVPAKLTPSHSKGARR